MEVLRYLGDRRFVDFHGRRSMIMCTGVGGRKGRRGSGGRRGDSRCCGRSRRRRLGRSGSGRRRSGNRSRGTGRREQLMTGSDWKAV